MRIIGECVYICHMKERLNLTIDGPLLEAMKAYAIKRGISVSELVEDHFRTVTRPVKRKNVLDLVDELKKPNIDTQADLKDLFYKEQGEKYGF